MNKTLRVLPLIVLFTAGVLSSFASGSPDGLERVAEDLEFLQEAKSYHADTPLADYQVRGIENPYLSTGLSGIIGVLMTAGVIMLFGRFLIKRENPGKEDEGEQRA